jgi:manganese transport protein
VLSFGIPFALIPLLLVTRDARVMREMTNGPVSTALMLAVILMVTGLNACLLYQQLRPLF